MNKAILTFALLIFAGAMFVDITAIAQQAEPVEKPKEENGEKEKAGETEKPQEEQVPAWQPWRERYETTERRKADRRARKSRDR